MCAMPMTGAKRCASYPYTFEKGRYELELTNSQIKNELVKGELLLKRWMASSIMDDLNVVISRILRICFYTQQQFNETCYTDHL